MRRETVSALIESYEKCIIVILKDIAKLEWEKHQLTHKKDKSKEDIQNLSSVEIDLAGNYETLKGVQNRLNKARKVLDGK